MSVHGEYSRALETLIACSRALPPDLRGDWPNRLATLRVDAHPDLSTAAQKAVGELDELEGLGLNSPPFATACVHLRAHCGMILGIQPD